MAREFTKPTITERGTNLISLATPSQAEHHLEGPPRITVAIRWSIPCSRITGAITRATAPVAAEIIAGRPPRKEIATAIVKEAKSPRRGSTPTMMENEIASGISASATTRPPSTSVRSIAGERSALRTVGSRVPVVRDAAEGVRKEGCSDRATRSERDSRLRYSVLRPRAISARPSSILSRGSASERPVSCSICFIR